MFGIGPVIKITMVLVIVLVIAGGLWHITGLKANLAVSEMNNSRLQEGIEQQKFLMEQMRQDIEQIQAINTELNQERTRQQKELAELNDRFRQRADGSDRDFGALAATRPAPIERAINRGTQNAMRCLAIASGSPLTEQELAATTSSEINRECPSIANPNYRPVTP